MNIQQGIQAVAEREDLSVEDAAGVMRQIMAAEATPAQFGAFVTALRMKGETPEEIAGMAMAMREVSLHVDTDISAVDTCGTGGDSMGWFNVSTAAAFVVAGAGAPVAKHGNRAMSGATGSADALDALGVKIDLGPDGARRCIELTGICFMFAQEFHPAMKFAGPLRPQLGIRTVFNLLGPLTNPAGTKRQVIGVYDGSAAEKIAKALSILGAEYTLVVHADSGADEIDVEGHTLVYQVTADAMKRRRTRPADFGLPEGSRSHLAVRNAAASAQTIRSVLDSKGGGHNAPPGPARSARNVVVMNAAAALLAAGKADSFQDGAALAMESIDSGAARERLERLVTVSNEAQ